MGTRSTTRKAATTAPSTCAATTWPATLASRRVAAVASNHGLDWATFEVGSARHTLRNATGYSTADLVRITAKAFRAYGIKTPKDVIFTSSPIRTRGCATVSPDRSRAVLSVSIAAPSKFTWQKLAAILRHECAHLRGLQHEDMHEELLYSEGSVPRWARGEKLRYVRRAPSQMKVLKRFS